VTGAAGTNLPALKPQDVVIKPVEVEWKLVCAGNGEAPYMDDMIFLWNSAAGR